MVPQIPLEHHTKPPQEQFCYVCAKRGHYGHQCPLKRSNLAHSQVPQSIVSYSYPVNLVNDNFVVNIEGSQEPILVSVISVHITDDFFSISSYCIVTSVTADCGYCQASIFFTL